MEFLAELAQYWGPGGSTRRVVMLGCTLLGISSGVLGTFALLRRQSLLGDAMAHAALPGVCLFFLLTHNKNPVGFLLGALFSGLIGAYCITLITRHSRIKSDTAIGLVLSVFFGFGIVLMTVIQQSGVGNQAGLDSFLFGKAAFLLYADVTMIGIMGLFLILFIALFLKEFKVLSFDPGFGASIGLPIRFLDMFLTSLIVLSVMIGLQAVGVILMAALLIIPAAAARQWTDRLGVMLWISGLFGGLIGAIGAIISTIVPKMPTGPVMVLTASTFLMMSILFAPKRGLLAGWFRRNRQKNRILDENVLKTLYKFGEQTEDFEEAVPLTSMNEHIAMTPARLTQRCKKLKRQGWLEQPGNGWKLTPTGFAEATRIVRNHRLWELYLTRQADIASDHVHRDADDMEHLLSPELVAQLEKLLESPSTDPHGKPIPSNRQEGT